MSVVITLFSHRHEDTYSHGRFIRNCPGRSVLKAIKEFEND